MGTGSVYFWCIFFGTKKTYKVENQILVGLLLRRALDSNGEAIEPIPYKKAQTHRVEQ